MAIVSVVCVVCVCVRVCVRVCLLCLCVRARVCACMTVCQILVSTKSRNTEMRNSLISDDHVHRKTF